MKFALILLGSAGFAVCGAQVPDVMVKLDVRATLNSARVGPKTLRFYDGLARPSTIGLTFKLEPGFNAYVSERLQRIQNDGDTDQLEAYYIEDPGIWRIGKQELPFGRRVLLRENAIAAMGETELLLEGVRVVGALCDNGPGRTRGIVGRIGGTVGLSAAYGEHFGISSSAATPLRRPEQALGVGRGYTIVFGADFTKRLGLWSLDGEVLALRDGATPADVATELSDLSLSYRLKEVSGRLGWSRDWSLRQDVYRIEGALKIGANMWIESLARMKSRRFEEFEIGFRVRM